jgi:polyvinyl alcohol dehydrogenase (cytochrome)
MFASHHAGSPLDKMLWRRSPGTGWLAVTILLLGCVARGMLPAVTFAGDAPERGYAEPAKAVRSERGARLFAARCSSCHDHARNNIPPTAILEQKSPEVVIAALTTGVMRIMANGLGARDIEAIAIHVTGKPLGLDASPTANLCKQAPGPARFGKADWGNWGADLSNTLYLPAPGLPADAVPRLRLKWAFAYPGGGAGAEPIAVGGRLFLASGIGLFALDAGTGCTYWHSKAGAGIKMVTAAAVPAVGSQPLLFFGDMRAMVSAVDSVTGKVLWTIKVDEHPNARITAPVTVHDGRVYAAVSSLEDPLSYDPLYPCCTFRGSVVALNAATGKILWKSYSIRTAPAPLHKQTSAGAELYGPAGGAIYAPLTIDAQRNLLYAVTAESYHRDQTDGANAIIAFDLSSGARKWARQPVPRDNNAACKHQDDDPDACDNRASALFEFAAPAVLATLSNGRQVLLAGQKSGVIYALDPDHGGDTLWERRVGQGGTAGGILYGFAASAGVAYVPVSDAEVKPPYTPGSLAALDIATGKLLWRAPAPTAKCSWGTYACSGAQAASVAAIPGIVFSGAWDGHMRAYAMTGGAIVWDVDTANSFAAVNGVKAIGGAVSGYPVIVADGALFVTSGAGSLTHPGNALLAFAVPPAASRQHRQLR